MGMHTGRMPYEDWGYAATSQGTTRRSESGLEQILPQNLQRWHGPAIILISDFQSLELPDNLFLLF